VSSTAHLSPSPAESWNSHGVGQLAQPTVDARSTGPAGPDGGGGSLCPVANIWRNPESETPANKSGKPLHVRTLLFRICNTCEAGTRWVSRHGGLDPDARPVRCDACDGTGEVVRYCEGWLCHRPANVLITFPDGASEPYCDACAVEMRAEAQAEGGFW
jgi:hypothetical protein